MNGILALYCCLQIVQEHGSNRHVVVMGDLNDFDADVPDSHTNQPNSNVIRQLGRDLGLHSVAGASCRVPDVPVLVRVDYFVSSATTSSTFLRCWSIALSVLIL